MKTREPATGKPGSRHIIKLIDHNARFPNAAAFRNYASDAYQALLKIIPELLDVGVIERCSGAVANPLVVVRKKNGTFRICIDLRAVNKQSVPQAHSTPDVSALVQRMAGYSYYLSVDAKNFFWAIPCEAASRDYLGFSVPGIGLFRFTRCPFGHVNSSAVAQQLMDRLWSAAPGSPEVPAVHYCDDRNRAANTPRQFIEATRQDLAALNQYNRPIIINAEKVVPLGFEVDILGHSVSKQGVRMTEASTQKLLDMQRPATAHGVLQFLGCPIFFRDSLRWSLRSANC